MSRIARLKKKEALNVVDIKKQQAKELKELRKGDI